MRHGKKREPLKPALKNFKLTLEYDGTRFNGWQAQSAGQRTRYGRRVRTVQDTIEDALRNALSADIRVRSSSRTDSGVHAEGHVINFKARTRLDSNSIRKALNNLLPRDLSVVSSETVDLGFDSRKDATAKVYRYTIYNREYRSPLLNRYSYHFRKPLDMGRMKKAAKAFLGRHDFRPLGNNMAAAGNTVRTIKSIRVVRLRDIITIDIEADGFLYNMARNITGLLIDVGRGYFEPADVKPIIGGKTARRYTTAPARGLCLMRVRYRNYS